MSSETAGAANRDVVGAVLKACALLEHFDTARPVWALNDLTVASGMNKTTVHRLMTTLVHAGWVARTADGAYRIAMPLFEIGAAAVSRLDIRDAAKPVLQELAATFGDTAYLMVPAESGAVCIDRVEGNNSLVVAGISIGSVIPYHAAAGPTVMLAYSPDLRADWLERDLPAFTDRTVTRPSALREHLDRVVAQGYSVSDADYLDGVAAVAAPILGQRRELVASVSVGGRRDAFDGDGLAARVDAVRAAARRLSRVAEALHDPTDT